MKKYIPGTLALTLMYIFLALAVTFGVKALAALPVIVYAQYRLLRRAKNSHCRSSECQRRSAVK